MWAFLVGRQAGQRCRHSTTVCVPHNRKLHSPCFPRDGQAQKPPPRLIESGRGPLRRWRFGGTQCSVATSAPYQAPPAGTSSFRGHTLTVHLGRFLSTTLSCSVAVGVPSLTRIGPASSRISSSRSFSSPSGGDYDSWTSAVQSHDGRTFTFATVVAEDASSAETPSALWDHACAMIGGERPTAAVVFVSHPTAGAIQAIADLSARIADVSTTVADVGGGGRSVTTAKGDRSAPPVIPPIIGCVADGWSGYAGEFTAARWKSRMGLALQAAAATSRQKGRPGTSNLTPGCEMDGPTLTRLLASLDLEEDELDDDEGPEISGEQSTRELLVRALQGSGPFQRTRMAGSGDESAGQLEGWNGRRGPDGQGGGGGEGEVDLGRLGLPGLEKLLNLVDGGRGIPEGEEGEGNTVEDWIQLCGEYEQARKGEGLPSGEELEMGAMAAEEGDGGLGEGSGPGLGAGKGRGGVEDAEREGDATFEEGEGRKELWSESRVADAKTDESKLGWAKPVNSSPEGTKSGASDLASGEPGEVERAVGKILAGGGPGGEAGSKQKFRLQLCLAHMPGVKGTAFFSPSPTLPYLPDLKKAVVEDNPHMLIIGAPGFPFPEYMRRLQSVFPEGSRAALFLHPLFETPSVRAIRGGVKERVGGSPVFYGPNVAYSGAVGLALNSHEGMVDRVPMVAFAEFVRMSLAFPRLHGLLLFDDNGSRHLFKPRINALQGLIFRESEIHQHKKGTALHESSNKDDEEWASSNPTNGKQTDGKQKNWVEQLAPYLAKGGRPKPSSGANEESTRGTTMYTATQDGLPLSTNEKVPSVPTQKGTARVGSRKPRGTNGRATSGTPGERLGGSSMNGSNGAMAPVSLLKRESASRPLFLGETNGATGLEEAWEDENEERLLPLAVFGSALFPGWTLGFNVFEPRFRLMVRQCLETESPCGIAAISPDLRLPQLIGTTAMLQVERFESDYRSFVKAQGRRRFRAQPSEVMIEAGTFGLNVAKVEYFDDTPAESESERRELQRLAKRTCTLCNRVVEDVLNLGEEVGMRFLNPWLLNDPVAASFAVAHVLPVENDVKLRWLAWTDTRARLLEQMHFLKAMAHRK